MDEWVSGLKLRSPPTVPALVPQLSGLLSVGSMDSCVLNPGGFQRRHSRPVLAVTRSSMSMQGSNLHG